MIKNTLYIIIGLILFSCSSTPNKVDTDKTIVKEVNPADARFNLAGSDEKAIQIADVVMENMGGRKAWDETKAIAWNFFGSRKLLWDKKSGNVRIQFGENDSNVIITNIFSHTGKVKLNGVEQLEPDSISKYTQMGESIWINDSYWLFMPFKLKDASTTLKYLTIDTTETGIDSHILELTFNEIGDTPENKYWVYVDTTTMLVNQWTFFSNHQDTMPRFTTPWGAYKKYGKILLGGDRGKNDITEIEVLDSISNDVFSRFK